MAMSEFDPVPSAPERPTPPASGETAAASAADATPPPPPPYTPPQPQQQQQQYATFQPGMAPPPRKSRSGVFFFGALSGCLVVLAGLFLFGILWAAMSDDTTSDLSLGGNKVAIIPIEGEILDGRETLDLLERYAENASVKAMVVRINSPGGAIAPSQEIFSAIRRVKADSGKPIVASLDSVAASGGFYIAAGCDSIVANPGSITGSIGVIMQWFDMKDLVQWAKLKPETITSGTLKDAGSPYRQMSDVERAYFQGIVKQLHEQFVRDVAHGRSGKLTYAEVAAVADGRVFTGEEALKLKLVDQLGSIDDAVLAAGKLAGIEGTPDKLWPKRREPTLFDLMGSGESEAILERIINRRIPKFLYKW
jgi:protease IV